MCTLPYGAELITRSNRDSSQKSVRGPEGRKDASVQTGPSGLFDYLTVILPPRGISKPG